MSNDTLRRRALAAAFLAAAAAIAPFPGTALHALPVASSVQAQSVEVPLNKSQVFDAGRPFTRAMVGSSDIADILPLSDHSLYVLGKKMGTTSVTLYDRAGGVIAVVEVAVGPDVVALRRQLAELMPGEPISARISNDSVILSGTVTSAPAIDRAKQIAATYAGEKVVNMMSVGGSQQVLLEVRFSEMNRNVGKQIGFNHSFFSDKGNAQGSLGDAATSSALLTNKNGTPTIDLKSILNTFGVVAGSYSLGGLNIFSAMDLLEQKGLVKTLAEPNLVALSGETASFLAGGEFPIPVAQNASVGGSNANGGTAITIEFKPFGVSLGFTPTILADGVINLVVTPEVSSLDPSASISVNGLVIPGLKTRRAKTTVELRDGQSFAIAGLLRSDFQDTVKQIPVLGSVPIIGTLFRSTGFQRGETELVMIVTPHIVKPMREADVRLPTDRVGDPKEGDLFLKGRTDTAVGNPFDLKGNDPAKPKTGFEGPVGHEF